MKTNKLVRDKIPEMIRGEGREPIIEVLNGPALIEALQNKLLEETEEFKSAVKSEDKLEELADMVEVIISLALHSGGSEEDLLERCHRKRERRGGFLKGIFYHGDKK